MKVVIDIPENDYKLACNYPDALISCYAHYIKAGVPLPKKHGRLIDADALINYVEDRYEITWESDCYEGGIKDACSDILEKIDTMPPVIEAEDGT